MKSINAFLIASISLVLFACGSNNSPAGSGGNQTQCPAANNSCLDSSGSTAIPTSTNGTIPIWVADQSTTGQYGYTNEPMVSVTICTPNHTSSSQCQTISNILLDTGSSGLRIFGSAINSNVQLTQQTVTTPAGSTVNLAECTVFGSGADWGPIQKADVLWGGQTASNIPVQVININYGQIPEGCSNLCPDTDPCTARYNGILGVAPFIADCGPECASVNDSVNPGVYFGCDGTQCYDAVSGNCGGDQTCMLSVAQGSQVSNPIPSFGSNNNGYSITLPSVGANGASGVTGSLTLGFTTVGAATTYPMDPSGQTDGNFIDFDTTYNGVQYGYQGTSGSTAFLDSGSNFLYFPSNLATCSDGLYCPSNAPSSQNATVAGYQGSPSTLITFSVGNGDELINTGNSAFNNIGAPGSDFDWGLPFFFGRTTYIKVSNTSPFWAF